MYTAYVLTDQTRNELLGRFPPKFPKVIAHHVTYEFGVPADSELPADAEIKVVGYVQDVEGLEALVVTVDGENRKPDGKFYHITWSLNPDKFKPVDSNTLVSAKRSTMILPITIDTTPTLCK